MIRSKKFKNKIINTHTFQIIFNNAKKKMMNKLSGISPFVVFSL